jgi:hypothetical protein
MTTFTTQDSIFVLTNASYLLIKIETTADHCKKLAAIASIDTLYQLATNLRMLKAWVSELNDIEEKVNAIVKTHCQQTGSDLINCDKHFEKELDHLINQGLRLDSQIGVTQLLENAGNIWASSKRCNREVQAIRKELIAKVN